MLRSTAPSEEFEHRGVVSSCVSLFRAMVIACAGAPQAGSPIGSQTDLLELEIHECRNRLHNVVCRSFVATLHQRGTILQYCQDVSVTATAQEETQGRSRCYVGPIFEKGTPVAWIRRAQKLRLKLGNCGNVTFPDENFKTGRST